MRLPRLDAFKFPIFSRLKSPPRVATPAPGKRPGERPFHGVSIAPGWSCCEAARGLEGQRFLATDAPDLPLPGCDQGSCDCAYRHHGDRRDGPRRDAEIGLPGLGLRPAEERRDRSERRAAGQKPAAGGAQDYFEHATGVHAPQRLNDSGKSAD